MNKEDLVKYVSDKLKVTSKDTEIIVDVFLDGVKQGLENGERVKLRGFGSFFIQERKPRVAVNPRTREVLDIPAKRVVKFQPAKKVVDMVN